MAGPGIKKRLEAIGKRGGKLVVVDPRRSETARIAQEHVFIRPGTDALFLLGLLHEICAAGTDLGRLRSHMKNVDRILTIAKGYAPSQTESVTGVPAETVVRLARELREAPKGVLYGRMGTSTQEFGSLCMWLINVINAVTGIPLGVSRKQAQCGCSRMRFHLRAQMLYQSCPLVLPMYRIGV